MIHPSHEGGEGGNAPLRRAVCQQDLAAREIRCMGKVDPGSTRDAEEVPRPGDYKSDYPGKENVSQEELGRSGVPGVEMVDGNANFRCIMGRICPYSRGRRGADFTSVVWRCSNCSLQAYGQRQQGEARCLNAVSSKD